MAKTATAAGCGARAVSRELRWGPNPAGRRLHRHGVPSRLVWSELRLQQPSLDLLQQPGPLRERDAASVRGVRYRNRHPRRRHPCAGWRGSDAQPLPALHPGKDRMKQTRRSLLQRVAAMAIGWTLANRPILAAQTIAKETPPDILVNNPSMVEADGRLRLD